MSDTAASARLRQIGYQRLALLFIVYALGALHSLELPPNDPSGEEYLGLAKRCLAEGDFLGHCTIAGVQALNIMGHYCLETENGRDGESAWPIWGLVMRIIQAVSPANPTTTDSRWASIAMGSAGACLILSSRSADTCSGNVTPSKSSK